MEQVLYTKPIIIKLSFRQWLVLDHIPVSYTHLDVYKRQQKKNYKLSKIKMVTPQGKIQ